jgi:hypothetical protein
MTKEAVTSKISIRDNEDLTFQKKSKIRSALSQLVYKEINNLKFELLVFDAEFIPSLIEQLPCLKISNLISLSHQQPDRECDDMSRNLINETKTYILKQLNDQDISKNIPSQVENDMNLSIDTDNHLTDNKTVNQFANSFLVELIDDSLNKNNLSNPYAGETNIMNTSALVEQKEKLAENYSFELSEQIINESFERISKCSCFAETLVDELFDSFHQMSIASNQLDDVKLATNESNEKNSNFGSLNSSILTTNSNSSNSNSFYRRHSADVSRCLNSITNHLSQNFKELLRCSNPLTKMAARRHSFNTFETSYKMRFEHLRHQVNLNESENSSSQSCIDGDSNCEKNMSSSGKTSSATKSRNRMFRTSCSSIKKPIITVLSDSTATLDSQCSDLVVQMPSSSSTNQRVCSTISNSSISCDPVSETSSKMPIVQYAKLTLKTLFSSNVNKANKPKTNYSSSILQSHSVASSSSIKSFTNELSNQIIVNAFDDITLVIK